MQRRSAYLIPSLSHIFFIIIFVILIMKGDSLLLDGDTGDGDTGYHIRAGDYIIEKLAVPTEDIFSYITPPLEWTAHEWLAEVIMSIIHQQDYRFFRYCLHHVPLACQAPYFFVFISNFILLHTGQFAVSK